MANDGVCNTFLWVGVFLDVWLVSVCFSVAMSAAQAIVSWVAAASYLQSKCQGLSALISAGGEGGNTQGESWR